MMMKMRTEEVKEKIGNLLFLVDEQIDLSRFRIKGTEQRAKPPGQLYYNSVRADEAGIQILIKRKSERLTEKTETLFVSNQTDEDTLYKFTLKKIEELDKFEKRARITEVTITEEQAVVRVLNYYKHAFSPDKLAYRQLVVNTQQFADELKEYIRALKNQLKDILIVAENEQAFLILKEHEFLVKLLIKLAKNSTEAFVSDSKVLFAEKS